MTKGLLIATLSLLATVDAFAAHIPGAAITWNREISRVFLSRCATCHRNGGTAFPMMNYTEVQPRAVAIKDAVLSRRMPPWGAVKGFGDFRDDYGLTQEEIELITDWVEGGARRGNNPNMLPKTPKFDKPRGFKPPKNAIAVSGAFRLATPLVLDGIFSERVPAGATMQVVAELPDGSVEPLVWLYEYQSTFSHPFLFKNPIVLPAGTEIRGVFPDARLLLIPGKQAKPKR